MTTTWVWPAVGLAFATWSVALGGIASLQADCENNTYALATAGVRGFSSGLACKKLYRYYWFMIAFEFIIVSGVALSLVAGLFRKTRVSWLGLFAVSALLYIQATDSFLTSRDRSFFNDGTPGHRMKTALAGYLMTAVANCFVIIALGLEPEGADVGKGDTVQATAV